MNAPAIKEAARIVARIRAIGANQELSESEKCEAIEAALDSRNAQLVQMRALTTFGDRVRELPNWSEL
jgi:hypothetical protein